VRVRRAPLSTDGICVWPVGRRCRMVGRPLLSDLAACALAGVARSVGGGQSAM